MVELSQHILEFMNTVRTNLMDIIETQKMVIEKAGNIMAEQYEKGNNIFAFGPGHAGMFAEEMFYRAGGLAITNPIFHSSVMINERPVTLTSAMEVLPGCATVILDESPLQSGDVLIIHSVAARNPIVVEMALKAKEKGIITIGIINMDYATHVTSRDPSGLMMQDVCDIVIDTCGVLGDACIEFDSSIPKMSPPSSILGNFIANILQLQMMEAYHEHTGQFLPVFQSANVDSGPEHNAEILKKYKDRIFYM